MRVTVFICLAIFLVTSCNPKYTYTRPDRGEWYVENSTDRALILTFTPDDNGTYRDRTVAPADSVIIQIFNSNVISEIVKNLILISFLKDGTRY